MPKLRIAEVEERRDGSGLVTFDLYALDDDSNPIPGKHTTVSVQTEDLNIALLERTPEEVTQAIWALVQAQIPDGWDTASLRDEVTANIDATTARSSLVTHVDSNLGGLPIDLEL